jgi:hypothetical protein
LSGERVGDIQLDLRLITADAEKNSGYQKLEAHRPG